MGEFLAFIGFCFAPANFAYSILLVLLSLYWLGVIAGGFDVEAGTPDFSFDAHVDAHVDAHADVDADVHAAPAWVAVLKFFNIGEVPLMVYLSAFVPCAWLLSVTATNLTGWAWSWLAALALSAPIVLVSAMVAKGVCAPLKALFRGMNREVGLTNKLSLAGREAVVVSLEVTDQFGQAEVPMPGAPLLLNVRCRPGETLRKGDRVRLEAETAEDSGVFRVEKA